MTLGPNTLAILAGRISEYSEPCPTTGCFLWKGAVTDGYARVKIGGRSYSAHRVAYQHSVGSIPEGMVLDHVCRERSCVNPDHLRVLTNKANILAAGATSPTAVNARKTSCPKCGGAYYTTGQGKRVCANRSNHNAVSAAGATDGK